MLKKSNIAYENGDFWVMQLKGVFQVMISGITHSSTDSSYSDFSIAKARCDYLEKHRTKHMRRIK